MHKLVGAAALATASACVFTLVAAGSADAFTQRELKICWADTTGGPPEIDLEVVADGPSYRTATLDTGECVAWDVKPGRYKITVENVSEFVDAIADSCDDNGVQGDDPSLKVRVKRQNQAYRVYNLSAFLNGSIETNVRNNRATTVSAHLRCF